MIINPVNSFAFENKKFRLPVKIVKPTDSVPHNVEIFRRESLVPGNFVREYSNPKAEEYFNKAQNASSVDEMLKYLEAMGEYKIIDIQNEKKINDFLSNLEILG